MIEVNFNIDSISQPVDAEELMMKVLVKGRDIRIQQPGSEDVIVVRMSKNYVVEEFVETSIDRQYGEFPGTKIPGNPNYTQLLFQLNSPGYELRRLANNLYLGNVLAPGHEQEYIEFGVMKKEEGQPAYSLYSIGIPMRFNAFLMFDGEEQAPLMDFDDNTYFDVHDKIEDVKDWILDDDWVKDKLRELVYEGRKMDETPNNKYPLPYIEISNTDMGIVYEKYPLGHYFLNSAEADMRFEEDLHKID
jgi:hypothetical protein